MQCPRCQHENHPQAKFCAECASPFNRASPTARSYADLKSEVESLRRALSEALYQQTATGEILRVISSSPTNLQPVMEAVAEVAARVCGAMYSSIFRLEGEHLRLVARHGSLPRPLAIGDTIPVSRDSVGGRAVCDRRTIHVRDLLAAEVEFPETVSRSRQAESLGRTLLATPLLREGTPLGVIFINRGPEVDPFSAKQIALLETFANQAVIAIENVRLFKELEARNRDLTEALARESATGAILRVMSGSPTNIQPVLDAVAESATRLCDAKDVSIALVDHDVLRVVASHGMLARWWPEGGVPINRGSVTGRAVVDRQTVHIHDLASESDEEFPQGKVYQRLGGHRTNLAVPLLREGIAIGVIAMRRGEVRPFTKQQVGLLQAFADQAVIAIENVRLFTELQEKNRALTQAHTRVTEALEQQTATSEILRVISGSPTDIQPVLDTIVTTAAQLCDAHNGGIFRFDGEAFRLAAAYNVSPAFGAYLEMNPIRPGQGSALRRAGLERRPVLVADVLADPELGPARAAYQAEEMRTALAVPMLKENSLIGAITMHRREVRPFTDKQIELVTTFADQAVIAIENVRLFTELQEKNRALSEAHAQVTESLEQQTATSEILRVISGSPTDVQPVFDAIVGSATRLCEATFSAVHLFAHGQLSIGSMEGVDPAGIAAVRRTFPRPAARDTAAGRAVLDRRLVHIADVTGDASYTYPEHETLEIRSILAVPMLREGITVGAITVWRSEVRPFTDKQIALLRTFADQAVIAIENVRLFSELQEKNRALTHAHVEVTEALEQKTATAEILRVISSSATDVQPVFDTIVESAGRLCIAESAAAYRFEGEMAHFVAGYHFNPEAIEAYRRHFPRPLGETDHLQRVLNGSVLNIADIERDPHTSSTVGDLYRSRGVRSTVFVPMVREGRGIGAIGVSHHDLAAFSDERVELLKTFADQAVIAIENVRLFTELQMRNAELTESLEQQTATAEILRVIASSPTDVQPVFATILDKAMTLAYAQFGVLLRYEGDELFRAVEVRGAGPEARALWQEPQRHGRPFFRATG